jgi:hypothetical protein
VQRSHRFLVRRHRWSTRFVIAGSALLLAAGAIVVTAWAQASQTSYYSFFTGVDTSHVQPDPDRQPVELGLRFRSAVAGSVDAVRFLKMPGDVNTHRVSVWTADGKRVASAVSTGESASGWQQVRLPKPVSVPAGATYTVSYHTSRYMASTNYFGSPLKVGPLAAFTTNGMYSYGYNGYPNQTWQSSNYWVDLLFETTAQVAPAPSPTSPTAKPSTAPSPSRSPSTAPSPIASQPTATGTASPTASAPQSGGLGLPTLPWEGGPSFYGQWASTKAWTDPNFFPIGVWMESILQSSDTTTDKANGLNLYVNPTDDSSGALMRAAGMWALGGSGGTETAGWELSDEADMIYNPGYDPWDGTEGWNTCIPIQDKGGKCGYTVMKAMNDRTPNDGRPRYANYGKGVNMWESDQDAQVFVNQYQQFVSSDMYFYTDPNLCPAEAQTWLGIATDKCRRSSSYGLVIDRLRKLDGMDGKRMPIYGFVEVGHPFTDNSAPTITGNQIAGAVMSSLIHGARGIIYFNHSFGGACQSQHLLRDACGAANRPVVAQTNQRITALAPVLNSPSYQWTANPLVDTMLKSYGGSSYLFAMPGPAGGTGTQTLSLPAALHGSTAQVMFEDRSVPISGGQITDSFAAEYSYHIYKITP